METTRAQSIAPWWSRRRPNRGRTFLLSEVLFVFVFAKSNCICWETMLCDTYCNIFREAMQKDRDAEDLERQVKKRRIFVTLFSVWHLITSNILDFGLSAVNRNTSKLCIWNHKCVLKIWKHKMQLLIKLWLKHNCCSQAVETERNVHRLCDALLYNGRQRWHFPIKIPIQNMN